MTAVRAMRLYFVSTGSDKQHVLHIYERHDKLFELPCQHGRNGKKLSAPTIKGPFADQATADKALASFVNAKTRDGYEIDHSFGDSTPAAGASSIVGVKARTKSNVPVMLLRQIGESELEAIITDNAFAVELKADGERTLSIVQENGDVMFVNKQGNATSAPTIIATILADLPPGTIVDGELMGDNTYFLFDCLAYGTTDLTARSARYRWGILRANVFATIACQDWIKLIPHAETEHEKRALLERARDTNAEGITGKRLDAPHEAGRGGKNAPAVKYRFVDGVSCIVTSVPAHDDTRSIGLSLLGPTGEQTPCGRVTIAANTPLPALGSIVEVTCRGANPGSNALWHPTYKGQRTDVTREDCTIDQLRYRNSDAEATLAS